MIDLPVRVEVDGEKQTGFISKVDLRGTHFDITDNNGFDLVYKETNIEVLTLKDYALYFKLKYSNQQYGLCFTDDLPYYETQYGQLWSSIELREYIKTLQVHEDYIRRYELLYKYWKK